MIWLVGRLTTGVRGTERITSGAEAGAEAEASTGLGIATGSLGAICAGASATGTGIPAIWAAGTGERGAVGGGTAGTERVVPDAGDAPVTLAAVGTVWLAREVRLVEVFVQPDNPTPPAMAKAKPTIREDVEEFCIGANRFLF
jgi:hypothetical protein